MSLRSHLAAIVLAAMAALPLRAVPLDLTTATIADIQTAFSAGTLTAEKLTTAYLARIEAYDKKGPALNAVIVLNPNALAEAKSLDAERKAGKVRGPLHGVPIVLKDNIDTFDLPTTAGSQLLEGSIAPDDAFVVKKLRAAGAIVIAKVNLSEWAGGGGSVSGATDPKLVAAGEVPNGYSSHGGQTKNPHVLDRGPAGSSGGTGVAIAAVFGQFGLGTDTAASVRGPANASGTFGLKTTHGLVSRDGVVPLALTFDTVGPLARSTYDLAAALNVLAGIDPDDDSTLKSAGRTPVDYTTYLKPGSLKGARIGIARDFFGKDAEIDAVVNQAIAKLKELGAIIVDDVRIPPPVQGIRGPLYNTVRSAEFKAQIAGYLATTAPKYPKNIYDLARLANDPATGYRSSGKAVGLKYQAETSLDLHDPVYTAAIAEGIPYVRAAMEGVFANHQLHAILYPTSPTPVSLINPPARESGPPSPGANPLNIANITGFPDLVVPAGMSPRGLPVTFSLLGRAFTEGRLLGFAYDYEQATKAIKLPVNTPALASDKLVP
ncbi:glutamyl-tRNA amidotransferase [Nibricoccus aquaticus]|uniref:Glutamyl-tRNA amidotransferase n=1 Tax=Nibricoccus aquaticus TaxID=2576891 RepID=A0A290QES2_9BACT|nr:amidase family protein [Nibricoccus aquaticus]ATC64766.1 glutamyl-tRNA amidotransferase [Nibricoccus aquaticus]